MTWKSFFICCALLVGGSLTFAIDVPPPVPMKIIPYAEKQAARKQLDWDWVYRLMDQECRWMVDCPAGDSGYSYGLAQIKINTARYWGGQRGMDHQIAARLLDPKMNIRIAMDVLNFLLREYDGSMLCATIAYNAGTKHANYVKKVMGVC